MAANTGETARAGDFRCGKWHEQVSVTPGEKPPRRPDHGGSDTFNTRDREPGNKSS